MLNFQHYHHEQYAYQHPSGHIRAYFYPDTGNFRISLHIHTPLTTEMVRYTFTNTLRSKNITYATFIHTFRDTINLYNNGYYDAEIDYQRK